MPGWHGLGSNLISKGTRRLGQLQLRFPKVFPNSNYVPQLGRAKSPRGLLQPGGGWHFSSVLPRAGGERAEPSWDLACPGPSSSAHDSR